jgi:hypothetical protein
MTSEPRSTSDSSGAYKESYLDDLRGRGNRIEVKFQNKRAYDIAPDEIDSILQTIRELEALLTSADRGLRRKLDDISNTCYAAIVLYGRSSDLNEYFKHLSKLANKLSSL